MLTGPLQGLFCSFRHDQVLLAGAVVPGRYPLPPPELAGDIPIPDVLHPVPVGIFEFFRNQAHFPGFQDRPEGRLGELFHFQEPLIGEAGFNNGPRPFGGPYFIGICFPVDQQALFLEFPDHRLPGFEPVHALKLQAVGIERSIRVKDIDDFQVVLEAKGIIVFVVGRGNLQTTRPEINSHVVVRDNTYFPVTDRDANGFSMQVQIAVVLRVHADRRIAQQRFRTGCRDNHAFIGPDHRIGNVVEESLAFLVVHLFIGQGGLCFRVPVHHPVSPVNQPLAVQVHEYPDHGLLHFRVHGKTGTVPVAGTSEFLELLQDDPAVLAGPVPGLLHKILPTD